MYLFHNIVDNYRLVTLDFVGISLSIVGLGQFVIHCFIAFSLFLICCLLGNKIKNFFFKEKTQYDFFANSILGYIAIGTGIGLLSIFSLLQTNILFLFLLLVTFYALLPFQNMISLITALMRYLHDFFSKSDWIKWVVVLFIIISFLRLLTPEIAEDGYHTDLPVLYLTKHTSMIESREMQHVLPYSQLPEMIYLIPIFLGDKETARFIHFGFYLLLIAFLFNIGKEKKYSFSKYIPLLFVTTSVVIRYSSSQYTDFFAIFPLFLSLMLIKKKMTLRRTILVGILFGSVIAAKIWMLVYLPVLVFYLLMQNISLKKIVLFRVMITFLLGSFIVPMIWYVRAYLLTGNPIFPLVNSLFIKKQPYEINPLFILPVSDYISFNWKMFTYPNLIVLSPLFFIGIVFIVFVYRKFFTSIRHSSLLLLFLLFTAEQLVIQISWGRYLLVWFISAGMIISSAIVLMLKKSALARLVFGGLVLTIFMYYFVNTLLILPYGFGWADKNAYLTRVLGRDNISYYDFENKFDKWISEKDLVATYGIGNFYYTNFHYTDVGYIYSKKNKSVNLLKEKKVTQLFIKGGDFEWFCKQLSLTGCNSQKVKLLATYPADTKKYNLYLILY